MTIQSVAKPKLQLEIETAPEDITIHVHGKRHGITKIDQYPSNTIDELTLITSRYTQHYLLPIGYTAIVISSQLKVVNIIYAEHKKQEIKLSIDNFLIVTYQNATQTLATEFNVNDEIKLRYAGKRITFKQMLNYSGHLPYICLNQNKYQIVIDHKAILSGSIENHINPSQLQLYINHKKVEVEETGTFTYISLLEEGKQGFSSFNVELLDYNKQLDQETIYFYTLAPPNRNQQPIFLWIEQGHNIVKLSQPNAIEHLVAQASDAGITSFIFDVKGIEGFAGYKKNHLTARPYVDQMKSPTRQGINSEHDCLDTLIRASKEKGMKVFVAFNVFAEGSYYRNDIALPKFLANYGQKVIDVDGQIVGHAASHDVQIGKAKIAYVNPIHQTVQQLQMNTIKEVMEHYDIDGIVLDRCRFDHDLADFSEETKEQFTQYCTAKGLTIHSWPKDICTLDNGNRVDGPLWQVWQLFRAEVITSFIEQIRVLVDQFNKERHKQVQLSTYVGSWYEYAHVHGINWSAKSYSNQQLFSWENESLYTSEYTKTGYANLLDFIIVGCYQQTIQEIEHYLTIAHYVTHSSIPVICGIALPYVKKAGLLEEILKLGITKAEGIMLFDHCHIENWDQLKKQLQALKRR